MRPRAPFERAGSPPSDRREWRVTVQARTPILEERFGGVSVAGRIDIVRSTRTGVVRISGDTRNDVAIRDRDLCGEPGKERTRQRRPAPSWSEGARHRAISHRARALASVVHLPVDALARDSIFPFTVSRVPIGKAHLPHLPAENGE
jgi:hypothetical protein